MKICPRCQKTYTDDSLNFCLDDGAVLAQTGNDAPQTVMMNEPRITSQPPPMTTQQSASGQQQWNVQPSYSMQPPPRKSRAWIWVLLILGLVAIVCGGGLAGVIYIGSKVDTNTNANRGGWNSSNSGTSSNSTSGRTNLTTVDLSKWVKDSPYGNTEFTGGEFIMSAKQKNYYYVLVSTTLYSTEKADTKVTLRNIDNAAASTMGYGLVFHSNPQPLQQDYAFLIDTQKQKYRVVHHIPQDEKDVIDWTSSTAINSGTSENTLEARDQGDTVDLYINGTKVTTIKNIYGYKGGVPGLYAGDGIRVAFKNLEIRK
ncbi:MAG: hypothetical protein JO053_03080 [Acidobacteria bacterium]|nr:hypothetical protein [Acidobacteriota bacterium]